VKWYKDTICLSTHGKGLYPFTELIEAKINKWHIEEGMCHLFIQHTSASLVISESYDPSARLDLEAYMERLAPENQAWHRHTLEGSDDSPSHMRAMLTQTSLSIPIEHACLSLGAWQGVYLFEHRARAQSRRVLLRCLEVD
jgi:secondary thiamine-phosphate synthase enzyme